MKTNLTVLSFEGLTEYKELLKVPDLAPHIVRINDIDHGRDELRNSEGTVVVSTHGTRDGKLIGPGGRRGWFSHEELDLEHIAAETVVVLACHQRRRQWSAVPGRVHTYSGETTPGNYRRVLAHLLAGNTLSREFTDQIRPGGRSPYDPRLWQHPTHG